MDVQKNEKVLAMYHAVWELIDEGHSVNSMKVSDITTRAGIGKGTAYEYFRSKEEIVSEALKYDYFLQYQSLANRLEEQKSFRSAIETCFNWLSENVDRRRFASQFFKESPCLKDNKKECEESDSFRNVLYLLNLIISLGRKDGSIREDVTDDMASTQIISQMFGYFLYQESDHKRLQKNMDAMKHFLCDNIEKSLR